MLVLNSSARGEPAQCSLAAKFREARLTEKALETYLAAGDCPDSDTAVADLRDRAGARELALARARVELAAKNPDSARLHYLEALVLDAGSAAAAEGLANLDKKETPDPFAAARALRAAGFEDEARTALIKALGEGKSKLGNDELRTLADPPNVWEKVRSWVKDNVQPVLGDVLTIFGVILVAFAVLNWTLFDWRRRRGGRRARVDNPSWIRRRWRRFTRPVLDLKAGVGDSAPILAAHMRALVFRVDADNGEDSIRLATYPEARLDLSDLATTDDRFKAVVAALKLITHRDTLTVKSSLADEDKDFKRAVLEIVARKTDTRLWTTRKKAGDKTTPTPGIVGAAVGWMLLNAERMRPRLREIGGDAVSVYGTDDADCYGSYLAGVETFRAGDISSARQFFAEAVAKDASYGRAQLNLAVTELLDGNPVVRSSGIRRLEDLVG